jgi:CPA2 family monovalent cation:H+ antiporter-2
MRVIAAGHSQIGEFSFIVGQAGVSLGILSQDQYSLILAAALLSIVVNPLLFKAVPLIERLLQRTPVFWRRLDRHPPLPEPTHAGMSNHVVVVGYGRVGEHIVNILKHLGIPHLVIEQDARQAAAFSQDGVPTLVGDAANSDVLVHAGLERARALVVTVPDESAGAVIIGRAQKIAPALPIVARAATRSGVQSLSNLGAQVVIHPELEGGLEVMRHTLQSLGYPTSQIYQYTDAVRRDHYNVAVSSPEERRVLEQLMDSAVGMEITWVTVPPDSPMIGATLTTADLRAKTGTSVIAIVRNHQVVANPKSSMPFAEGDLVGLIGNTQQMANAARMIETLTTTENA